MIICIGIWTIVVKIYSTTCNAFKNKLSTQIESSILCIQCTIISIGMSISTFIYGGVMFIIYNFNQINMYHLYVFDLVLSFHALKFNFLWKRCIVIHASCIRLLVRHKKMHRKTYFTFHLVNKCVLLLLLLYFIFAT